MLEMVRALEHWQAWRARMATRDRVDEEEEDELGRGCLAGPGVAMAGCGRVEVKRCQAGLAHGRVPVWLQEGERVARGWTRP